MKSIFKISVLALVALFLLAMKPTPKRVIFFGDSVTEQGVLPNGYISVLKSQLDSTQFQLIGAGIGGNKVYDLYLRLESDVLDMKPDLVFIYVGINDVWHKETSKTGTDLPKYVKFYQALIDKIKGSGAEVVLVTPSVIGEKKNGENELDSELDKYSDAIRKLAQKNNLPLCDLRKTFIAYEANSNTENLEKGILTTDRVHLNAEGNRFVAQQILPFIK